MLWQKLSSEVTKPSIATNTPRREKTTLSSFSITVQSHRPHGTTAQESLLSFLCFSLSPCSASAPTISLYLWFCENGLQGWNFDSWLGRPMLLLLFPTKDLSWCLKHSELLTKLMLPTMLLWLYLPSLDGPATKCCGQLQLFSDLQDLHLLSSIDSILKMSLLLVYFSISTVTASF